MWKAVLTYLLLGIALGNKYTKKKYTDAELIRNREEVIGYFDGSTFIEYPNPYAC